MLAGMQLLEDSRGIGAEGAMVQRRITGVKGEVGSAHSPAKGDLMGHDVMITTQLGRRR